jgi:hypothetical protein
MFGSFFHDSYSGLAGILVAVMLSELLKHLWFFELVTARGAFAG